MRNIFKLLVLGLMVLPAQMARADGMTPSLSLFYFTEGSKTDYPGTNDPNASSKLHKTYTFLNLGVCYNLSGFCVGLKYLQGEIETKVSSPAGHGVSTAKFHAPGLTLGYSGAEGIVAHVSVLFDAKKDIDDLSATYYCKSAYMVELGYGFKVSSVRIGPLLGIYQFDYNKKEVGGVRTSLKPNENDSFIMPQVALWVDL